MGILIDPYMFELSDEKEIENNIDFFRRIIKLSEEHRICIVFYKDMIQRIHNREIQPFPIKLKDISDKDLKSTIMQVNRSFSHILLNMIESVESDECNGNQEFKIYDDDDIEKDSVYFEMFITLLIPCYSQIIGIDNKILTGNKKDGKHIGDTFRIDCSCDGSSYTKKCIFSGVEEMIPEKERVLETLRKRKKMPDFLINDMIPAELGSHHNHVQADGKGFNVLMDLSFKNKKVLKLLQELGLKKIIFGNFTPQGGKEVGSIRICDVFQEEEHDIVRTKFIAETEFEIVTDLYFPKEVGILLKRYFQKERIVYWNMNELIEKM